MNRHVLLVLGWLVVATPLIVMNADVWAQSVASLGDGGSIEIPGRGAGALMVDDFNEGSVDGVFYERRTSIGGYHGTFAKRPSYAMMSKSQAHRFGRIGQALELQWHKSAGWCGYYTLLQDSQGRPADVSRFNVLSFRIKGEKGGERFNVGLSDKRMQDLQVSAHYLGDVNQFLSKPISTTWQEVKVPLALFDGYVDLKEMGSLVLLFRDEGEGKVYVDDILFRYDRSLAKRQEQNTPDARSSDGYPRGMWVWKVDPINNPTTAEGLLRFAGRTATNRFFFYCPTFEAPSNPEMTKKLQTFIELCRDSDVKIDALTGNPIWAIKSHHAQALEWVDRVLAYNKVSEEPQRIDGVILDIELHLLPQWETDRAQVKQEFVKLLSHIHQRLNDGQDPPPSIGLAIPMAFEKEEQADQWVSQILQYVDFMTVMAYQDRFEKIIEPSRFFVELAKQKGKTAWIAVETQDLVSSEQGYRHNTFWEEGWIEMEKVLGEVQRELKDSPGFGGISIHSYYSYRQISRDHLPMVRQRETPNSSTAFSLSCSSVQTAMRIDGQLDEWKDMEPSILDQRDHVAFNPHAWNGPDDLSIQFWSRHDQDNIYFAFDVTDDQIVQVATGKDLWEGDHIELWLDLDLMNDYDEASLDGDDFQFGLSPGNFKDLGPEVYLFLPHTEVDYDKSMRIASVKTNNGYTLELVIPKALLEELLKQSRVGRVKSQHRVGIDSGSNKARTRGLSNRRFDVGKIGFQPGTMMGIAIEPSDCDDPIVPQKTLMSTSSPRTWGDPTTFGFLSIE